MIIFYISFQHLLNLGDISIRALKILSTLDVIFCEDTESEKLLKSYDIKPSKLLVYNDHSNQKQRKLILDQIKHSKNKFGLVSDIGTPVYQIWL